MNTHIKAVERIRNGDKENSAFFEEALPRIFARREESGLEDLLMQMRGVVIQISTGEAVQYMAELYLMTPYRFRAAYKTRSHNVYILTTRPAYPALFLLEPLSGDYHDEFTALNSPYPRAKEKLNAKYIGEIYQTKDLQKTVEILRGQQFRFQDKKNIPNAFLANDNFAFTLPSYYTNNVVGYTEQELTDYESLHIGERFELTAEEKAQLEKADIVQREYKLYDILYGIDHLATRVLSGDREDAILEFLSLTNYYFWGAYNIEDMNSSTNICRSPFVEAESEMESPAKVFTANNNPYYTNSIVALPSPTEDFVRNFGKRMHHIAYAVEDGELPDGTKNIDYVVGKLIEADMRFLENVIGECTDFPDLKQIFSKSSKYSLLITEYVQRCHGFEGFFTKGNVAHLTGAAGLDEALGEEGEENSGIHD